MSQFDRTHELRDRFLQAAYDLGRNRRAQIVGLDEIAGVMQGYMDTSEPRFVDELDVVAVYLGEQRLIKSQASGYGLLSITTKGIDKVEGNEEQVASGSSFVFNAPGQGSIIGTNNTAELTNTFDFRSLEQQIEREGGEDKEELRAALIEVRQLLEQGESLKRGMLSRYSGVMEKHSWFTGSVMQALLGFTTQAIGR